MWPSNEALSAIAAVVSALTAVVSVAGLLRALAMQRQSAIDSVRPELIPLDWHVADGDDRTTVRLGMIRNVGSGPAFDVFAGIRPEKMGRGDFYGSILICPYIAHGTLEQTSFKFACDWTDEGRSDGKTCSVQSVNLELSYRDLVRRGHLVTFRLDVSRSPDSVHLGAIRLGPRVFLASRQPTKVWDPEPHWYRRLRGMFVRAGWRAESRVKAFRKFWDRLATEGPEATERPDE